MIANIDHYEKAQAELRDRLRRLQHNHPLGAKGFTNGVRKMIARLHEELALYEGGQEIGHIKHP